MEKNEREGRELLEYIHRRRKKKRMKEKKERKSLQIYRDELFQFSVPGLILLLWTYFHSQRLLLLQAFSNKTEHSAVMCTCSLYLPTYWRFTLSYMPLQNFRTYVFRVGLMNFKNTFFLSQTKKSFIDPYSVIT